MAYGKRKRRYKRRSRGMSLRRRRRGGGAMRVALRALRMSRGEMKHITTDIFINTPPTSPRWRSIDITQGTDGSQRVGNAVTIKSISLRGSILGNPGSDIQTVRLLLVRDRQPGSTGSVPLVVDVVEDFTNPNSILNRRYIGRFQVMWSRVIRVYGDVVTGKHEVPFRYYKRMNLRMRWGSGSATIPNTNPIYLFTMTDDVVNFPTIKKGVAMMQYTDK